MASAGTTSTLPDFGSKPMDISPVPPKTTALPPSMLHSMGVKDQSVVFNVGETSTVKKKLIYDTVTDSQAINPQELNAKKEEKITTQSSLSSKFSFN